MNNYCLLCVNYNTKVSKDTATGFLNGPNDGMKNMWE